MKERSVQRPSMIGKPLGRGSLDSTSAIVDGDERTETSLKDWVFQKDNRIMLAGIILSVTCFIFLIAILTAAVSLCCISDF